jgi:cytochrome P450
MRVLSGHRECVEALVDASRWPPPDVVVASDLTDRAARIRRVAYAALAPGRWASTLASRAVADAAHLLVDLPSGSVDLVSGFSLPFAERVVASYLELPRDPWHEYLAARLSAMRGSGSAIQTETSFVTALQTALPRLRDEPTGGVLSVFAAAADEAGFGDDDTLRIIPRLAVNASLGIIDLVSSLSLFVVRGVVTDGWSAERVVDEVLRLDPPVKGVARVDLVDDVDVVVDLASANRDPSVFAEPHRFDPGRTELTEHLAFGRGHEACVGAPIARMAGVAALRALWSYEWSPDDHPIERWPMPYNPGIREVWARRGPPRAVGLSRHDRSG